MWIIEAYEGTELQETWELPQSIGENQMRQILQLLCAKYLSEDEIFACFRGPRAQRAAHLDPVGEGSRAIMYGHGAHYFTARISDA